MSNAADGPWREVEEILDERGNNNKVVLCYLFKFFDLSGKKWLKFCGLLLKIEYLVKWKRGSDDEDSDGETETEWVPRELCNCPVSIAEYKRSIGVRLNWFSFSVHST